MSEIDKVLEVAIGEIGYKEKASNKSLDSKTANAGSNNYTKYGRDLRAWVPEAGDTYGLNYQWCDQFVDWCFIKALGKERAKALLYGWSAYTPTSSQYFKNKGRYDKNPKRGDIVFFYSSSEGRIGHTGIVEKVNGNTVYTIEGNSSNQVIRHSYNYKTSSYVNGFAHPAYKEETKATKTESKTLIPAGIYKTVKATGEVTASVLNVRTWAGTQNANIKSYPTIKKGERVGVCSYITDDEGAKWYYIIIKNDKYGFVHSKYIRLI